MTLMVKKMMKNGNIDSDVVNPVRYTKGSIEPWDFISDHQMTFDEGNVIKYIVRHRYKDGIKDLKKVVQYVNHLAEKEYGESII